MNQQQYGQQQQQYYDQWPPPLAAALPSTGMGQSGQQQYHYPQPPQQRRHPYDPQMGQWNEPSPHWQHPQQQVQPQQMQQAQQGNTRMDPPGCRIPLPDCYESEEEEEKERDDVLEILNASDRYLAEHRPDLLEAMQRQTEEPQHRNGNSSEKFSTLPKGTHTTTSTQHSTIPMTDISSRGELLFKTACGHLAIVKPVQRGAMEGKWRIQVRGPRVGDRVRVPKLEERPQPRIRRIAECTLFSNRDEDSAKKVIAEFLRIETADLWNPIGAHRLPTKDNAPDVITPVHKKRKVSKKSPSEERRDAKLSPSKEDMLQEIKKLRLSIANNSNPIVTVQDIFGCNKVLKEIAILKPRSMQELLKVPGIKGAQKHGEELLQLIQGYRVLARGASATMPPMSRSDPPHRRKTRVMAAPESVPDAVKSGPHSELIVPDVTESTRSTAAPPSEEDMLQAIKRLRLSIANNSNPMVSMEQIFGSNKVLKEIAIRKPRSMQELLKVPGIKGPSAQKHGEELLQLIGDYRVLAHGASATMPPMSRSDTTHRRKTRVMAAPKAVPDVAKSGHHTELIVPDVPESRSTVAPLPSFKSACIDMLQAIKRLRLSIANNCNPMVPTQTIFGSNKVLTEIVIRMPGSMQELLKVPGIERPSAQKHGEELLQLIGDYRVLTTKF